MANALIKKIISLENRLAELERRRRNGKRTGTITEVDTAKGLARVQLTDDNKPFITGWIPWKEIAAGTTSTHIPPVTGQQVDVLSENGDMTDGMIDFSIHSNKNPRPASGSQPVIQHGNTKITLDIGSITIETSGDMNLKAATVKINGNVEITGGKVSHNGKNIGDSHTHGGVIPGGANTAPPN